MNHSVTLTLSISNLPEEKKSQHKDHQKRDSYPSQDWEGVDS